MTLSKGDRVLTPYLETGTVLEIIEGRFLKAKVDIDGLEDPQFFWVDSLRLHDPEGELERVIVRAEYSESSDAIMLAAEIRRLRKAVRQAQSDAWQRGMADAKLQALGIRPLVRNPYLEDE